MDQLDEIETQYRAEGKLISYGKVVRFEKGCAWVETESTGSCFGCSSKGGCGTGSLSQLFSPSISRLVKIKSSDSLVEGDKVLLSIVESHLIKHSLMAYGLPLALLMLGAWIGLKVFNSDLLSAVFGFIFMFLAWLATKYLYTPVLPKLEKVLVKRSLHK